MPIQSWGKSGVLAYFGLKICYLEPLSNVLTYTQYIHFWLWQFIAIYGLFLTHFMLIGLRLQVYFCSENSKIAQKTSDQGLKAISCLKLVFQVLVWKDFEMRIIMITSSEFCKNNGKWKFLVVTIMFYTHENGGAGTKIRLKYQIGAEILLL